MEIDCKETDKSNSNKKRGSMTYLQNSYYKKAENRWEHHVQKRQSHRIWEIRLCWGKDPLKQKKCINKKQNFPERSHDQVKKKGIFRYLVEEDLTTRENNVHEDVCICEEALRHGSKDTRGRWRNTDKMIQLKSLDRHIHGAENVADLIKFH